LGHVCFFAPVLHWFVSFFSCCFYIEQESAFEGPVFTHSDVKPGMVTKAKVISVDTFGAIVQFSGGLKAMCPLRHMSEFEVTKPRKKFKVGYIDRT